MKKSVFGLAVEEIAVAAGEGGGAVEGVGVAGEKVGPEGVEAGGLGVSEDEAGVATGPFEVGNGGGELVGGEDGQSVGVEQQLGKEVDVVGLAAFAAPVFAGVGVGRDGAHADDANLAVLAHFQPVEPVAFVNLVVVPDAPVVVKPVSEVKFAHIIEITQHRIRRKCRVPFEYHRLHFSWYLVDIMMNFALAQRTEPSAKPTICKVTDFFDSAMPLSRQNLAPAPSSA